MNTLVFLCFAATAAVCCHGAQFLSHPGIYGYLANNHLGAHVAYNPVPYSLAPLGYRLAHVAPIQSQYHAQDELGQYSFGYSGGPSSRAETRDAFGVVRGSYNYIDSEGKLQTQKYVADALGFRVAGTNLPVAPASPEALALVGPEPVQDTPEVAAAKAAFQKAYNEAAAAAEAAPDTRKKRSVVTPANTFPLASPHTPYAFTAPVYSHPHPFRYPYRYPYPLSYSYAFPAVKPYTGVPAATTYAAATPAAVRDATLLRVVHNPGHAVSYRVD